MKKTILIILSVSMLIACKKNIKAGKTDSLGAINIEVTGNVEAATHFEKGLLLLHSFEYEDARESFIQAQETDTLMAMAYWGEAMTYNHSLWREQDFEKGTEALKKIETIDFQSTCSVLELDFIKAVQILYQPILEKEERDVNYAQYMEQLSKKYPANHEISAFYALSLLGAVPDGRDDEMYGKGAIIAKGIIEENPNHPGALHYLIHSYDDPKHAYLALNAADSYAKVAPDASHALHMPSHIYVAMGMWDEVISSNIDSYQASLNRMERKNLDNNARGYHAYHWLQYGYLQKENVEEAKNMLVTMEKYTNETPSKRARVHLVFLKGTYLVNSENWDSDEAAIEVDIVDLNVSIRSQYYFLEGMKAYKKEDIALLDQAITTLENDYKRESYVASDQGGSFCSGISRDVATQSDLVEAQVRQHQLLALRANLDQDFEKAEAYFLKSIALNESISYSYGPPSIKKPTRELYADWLLSQNRKEEAKTQYEASLKMNPNRTLVVKGIENSTI
tara:strand:+ start:22123 stop:23646 length:1524 start_codon:yes stop_codon:yes gene_type:complete